VRKAQWRWGWKEPYSSWTFDPILCFSLFYSVKIMWLWSPRCVQWNGTIFEPSRSLARARASRPPAGYAPPLLDKYAPSQHSQYRIQLRLIVFSARNRGERKTDDPPCAGVFVCVRGIMLFRTSSIPRIAATRKVCVMRIKCDKISRNSWFYFAQVN